MLAFGLSLSAIALRPHRADAELYDITDSYNTAAVRLVGKTNANFGTADLTISPIVSTGTITDLSNLTTVTFGQTVLNNRFQNPSFGNNNVIYIAMGMGAGTFPEGTEATIITNYSWSFFYRSTTSGAATQLDSVSDNWRYFVAKSGNSQKTEIFPDENGVFTMPFDVGWLYISSSVSGMGSLSSRGYVSLSLNGKPHIFIDVLETSMERIVNDQTDMLMGTDGSSSVLDDVAGQGQQISQNLNFVQQTGQFVTGAFDAVANSEEVNTVTFPGLSLMGFTIQPANVSLTQYISSDLLELIRTGVTMVVFLAWFSGLRAMYHRIFLGQTQIEVVDE